jgi:hypothetical protein
MGFQSGTNSHGFLPQETAVKENMVEDPYRVPICDPGGRPSFEVVMNTQQPMAGTDPEDGRSGHEIFFRHQDGVGMEPMGDFTNTP